LAGKKKEKEKEKRAQLIRKEKIEKLKAGPGLLEKEKKWARSTQKREKRKKARLRCCLGHQDCKSMA